MVLCHGYLGARYDLVDFAEALAAAGFVVAAPEFAESLADPSTTPGYARPGAPPPVNPTASREEIMDAVLSQVLEGRFGVDVKRDVAILGHSAGAAMAMVMLATWPDRFAAGGVIAGIPYRCANSVSGAFSCQSPGVDQSPDAWAQLVRDASPHTGPWPRLSI